MTAFATCPRCSGFPEFDEEGRIYTCFVCCNTGSVSTELAEAIEREESDNAEQFVPARLGVFACIPVEFDEVEFGAPVPGTGLFTRLVRPIRARVEPRWDVDMDIPF